MDRHPNWRPPQRKVKRYTGWLAAGYIAGPLLGSVTMGTGFLAPAIVHWAHGEANRGLVSLGGSLFLPLLGGAIALALVCDEPTNCDDSRANWAVLAGAGATYAMWAIYDCARNTTTARWAGDGLRLTPYASVASDDNTVFGLAGAF